MSKHKSKTFSEEQIRVYQEGKRTEREAHEVERTAFDSDFDADALEGLSSLPTREWKKDLNDLRARLATKKKSSPYLQIAAVVSLLILAGLSIWFLKDQKNNSLAYQESPKAKEEVQKKVDNSEEPISLDKEGKKEVIQEQAVSKPEVAQKEESPAPKPQAKVDLDVEKPTELALAFADKVESVEVPELQPEETLVMEEAVEVAPEEDIALLSESETSPAPATQMPTATPKMERAADVRSRLNATGAVSRSMAAPSSIEILDCNPAEGSKNRSFRCATPEDMEALNEYLIANKTTSDYSTIILELLIDETGAIESIQVPESRNPDLENELIRLLQDGPKWMPAQLNGGVVSAKVILGVVLSE